MTIQEQEIGVNAIEAALRDYVTTNENPCGGAGYHDEDDTETPWRVHYADGVVDESFATLREAIDAATAYADEMDSELNSK